MPISVTPWWLWGFLNCVPAISFVAGFVFNPIQQDRIQRMGNSVLNCGDIPGLSMAVTRGKDTWTLSMGVANMATKEPITDATSFAIGSLTKAFTSTLLLTLLQESKEGYTIDTPLKDILHQDHLFHDNLRSQKATIKDILSHRTGLARADLALFSGYPDTFSLDEMTRALHCLPVQAPFRDTYLYSNFMYNLAGHVIEKLSNQSYATVMKNRILGPLRMTASRTHYNVADPYDGMAQPYLTVHRQVEPAHHSLFRLKQFLPSLGLASNARDMVKWLRVQLGPYQRPRDEATTVIADEVILSTHQPVIPHINNLLRPRFPVPDLTFAYGLGWHQAVYKGFRRLWHSGTLFGFTSFVWLFPDLDIGLFIAVNGPARGPDTRNRINAFLYYVTDLLLGDPAWLSQSTICTYPLPRANQKQGNIHATDAKRMTIVELISDYCDKNNVTVFGDGSLEKYSGTFYNMLFGEVHVYFENNLNDTGVTTPPDCPVKLRIRFGERFRGILLPSGKRHFFQMKPVGIFEFSAYTTDHELSTMPVEFLNFDLNGIPHSLKAVWQTVEIIQYSRDKRREECFVSSPNGASRTISKVATLPYYGTLILMFTHLIPIMYRPMPFWEIHR